LLSTLANLAPYQLNVMKKCLTYILLFTTILFNACKKDDNKDYAALFKNTVWSGEFNYSLQQTQSLSLEFRDNGTVWRWEMSKDYGGTFTITGNQLKVDFGSGRGFEAEVTKDNKLKNIKNLALNEWTLTSAAYNPTPEIPLENTKWKAPGITLEFKANNIVNMSNATGTTWTLNYTRKPKAIGMYSSQWNMFAVITSTSNMRGANQVVGQLEVHPFSLTKE
jgi:hypothetical protein